MNDFECPRCGHCCQSDMSLRTMKHIKTWSERCEEHPDHQERIITERMIQARMQEEIDELRQALETGQEPVAWISDSPTKGNGKQLHWTKSEAWRWSSNITPLYTAPPKQWVGLTDEEIQKVVSKKWWDWEDLFDIEGFSRAIERVLKEKNHD